MKDVKEALIGKKFRRNKYGLSIWEDTIEDVNVLYQQTVIKNVWHYIPKITVMGVETKKNGFYLLDEIILVGNPVTVQQQELHKALYDKQVEKSFKPGITITEYSSVDDEKRNKNKE